MIPLTDRRLIPHLRPPGSALTALFVAVSLAGCSGGVSSRAADPTPTPTIEVTTPEPEPVTTPEPEPVTILTDMWTDSDGYSFGFEFQTATTDATKDIANALPGEANITWTYSLAGEIKNATPQRNAPAPNYIVVVPAWPSGSAVCSLEGNAVNAGVTAWWYLPTREPSDQWCTVPQAPVYLAPSNSTGEIPMGSSIPVAGSLGGGLAVPEAQADAVIAELKSPAIWVIGRSEGEGSTNCMVNGNFTMDLLYLRVATTDIECLP